MRSFVVIVVALAAAGSAAAEGNAQAAAKAGIEAFDAGDRDALAALATRDEPEPWEVAEYMLLAGRADAATAFAEASPRPATEGLIAYIASRPKRAIDPEYPPAVGEAVAAIKRKDPEAALAALERVRLERGTVLFVQFQCLVAMVFAEAGRQEESLQTWAAIAAEARSMGWVEGVRRASESTAMSARALGRPQTAIEAYGASIAAARRLGRERWAAAILVQQGNLQFDTGQVPAAARTYEEALDIARRVADEVTLGVALGESALAHSALGNHETAIRLGREAVALKERTENWNGTVLTLKVVADVLRAQRAFREAREALDRAARIIREHGLAEDHAIALALARTLVESDAPGEALDVLAPLAATDPPPFGVDPVTVWNLTGVAHSRRGEHAKATDAFDRALRIAGDRGARDSVAAIWRNLALVHVDRRDWPGALAAGERAVAEARAAGNRATLAEYLAHLGDMRLSRGGDTEGGLAAMREASDLHRMLGNTGQEFACVLTLSDRMWRLGDNAKSLHYGRRALELAEGMADRAAAATAFMTVGRANLELGRIAESRENLDRALRLAEESGVAGVVDGVREVLGHWYLVAGDPERALAEYEETRRLRQAEGTRGGLAVALNNIGTALHDLRRFDEALRAHQESLRIEEEMGNKHGVAVALGNLGTDYQGVLALDEALQCQERALALHEEVGDRVGALRTLANIGSIHRSRGDLPRAIEALERALRAADRLRSVANQLFALEVLALARADAEDWRGALADSRRAVDIAEESLTGLGAEEGGLARSAYAKVYATGVRAASELDSPADAVHFLESGRAGALLESLGGREAMQWSRVPAERRRAELAARESQTRAIDAYRSAIERGTRSQVREAEAEVERARSRVREEVERTVREAKRDASVFYPRAAPIEDLQAALADDEAMVLYGFALDEVVAVVLTHDGARIVPLGEAARLLEATASATALESGRDAAREVANARRALVKPLGLPDSVRRVLVAPEGPLAYLPLGAVFREQEAVAIPSGSTWLSQREDRARRGERVLALGDPDYSAAGRASARSFYWRGRPLPRLPASRAEAEAVGDTVLLGAEASEAGLAAALGKEARWRSVHLACHGLFDPERASRSSLALAPVGEGDGFLDALEVFQLPVSSDLVVLSACESGKGKIVAGEGIVGLTRAFMYAGTPRVIVSLWKVDDEATRALMTRFYELWKSGAPTARALKEAQEFVRSQEKWSHPHYWAAWVLWGLAD